MLLVVALATAVGVVLLLTVTVIVLARWYRSALSALQTSQLREDELLRRLDQQCDESSYWRRAHARLLAGRGNQKAPGNPDISSSDVVKWDDEKGGTR